MKVRLSVEVGYNDLYIFDQLGEPHRRTLSKLEFFPLCEESLTMYNQCKQQYFELDANFCMQATAGGQNLIYCSIILWTTCNDAHLAGESR